MANEIVSWRNVQVTDFHRLQQYLKSSVMKEVPSIGPGRIIRRRQDGSLEYLRDDLTIEEPLEIRIGGKTLATTMRTPGHDEELAAGFLVSEAIVHDRSAIARILRDGDNKVIVDLASGVQLKLNSAQRFGTISSSCGLCGKTSIDAIRQSFPAIESTNVRIDIDTLLSLPEKLQKAQGDFARTGGIHAAGIFDSSGELKTVREDIGRHNAVDKVIGRAFLDGLLPLNRHVLLVSGRASFEIAQVPSPISEFTDHGIRYLPLTLFFPPCRDYARIFRRSARPGAAVRDANLVADRPAARFAQANQEKPGHAASGPG